MKYILILCLFMLCGCTARLTDFTVVSTKNIDLARGAEFVREDKRVEGTDTKFIFLFIPFGLPDAKEAVDKAIESTPGGVALLDGVLEKEWFWFIFGYEAYRVKGTPLVDPMLLKRK
ncbi:hypothetical protein [Geomonas subterranea]|uniref:hypothetical protein n=1 Tax=Geomonas subterranea TaxID=2847989 RepID=UPI001CD2276B|nr:hypothetical protein [Geomonas fuzhouensis]